MNLGFLSRTTLFYGSNLLVIPTFVAKVQLFSFFKSREKAIRITGGHWLAQWYFFAVYMQETVIETGEGIVMAIAFMPVVVTCYLQ